MIPIHLYQFPVSHFCEKARWALDFKLLTYTTHNLMPVFHVPRMLAISRQTQVPVVQLDGQWVLGSAAIIEALEQRFAAAPMLFPKHHAERMRAIQLASFCDREIGGHVRRVAYYNVLTDRDYTYGLLAHGQSTFDRLLLRGTQPLVTRVMRAGMGINAKGYQRSLDKLNSALDRLDQEIQPSGYLSGSRFSVADLTAAALLSPLTLPPQTMYAQQPNVPQAMQDLAAAYAQRPCFQWALEIYNKHRV